MLCERSLKKKRWLIWLRSFFFYFYFFWKRKLPIVLIQLANLCLNGSQWFEVVTTSLSAQIVYVAWFEVGILGICGCICGVIETKSRENLGCNRSERYHLFSEEEGSVIVSTALTSDIIFYMISHCYSPKHRMSDADAGIMILLGILISYNQVWMSSSSLAIME